MPSSLSRSRTAVGLGLVLVLSLLAAGGRASYPGASFAVGTKGDLNGTVQELPGFDRRTVDTPMVYENVAPAAWNGERIGAYRPPVAVEQALLVVEPAQVSIGAEIGEVHAITLSVTSADGGSPVDWAAVPASQPAWVSVGPLQGTTPSLITLTAECIAAAQGTYQMSLTFSATGATEPLLVPITIAVEPPTMALMPPSLPLIWQPDWPDPLPRHVAVTQRQGDGQGVEWEAQVMPPGLAARFRELDEPAQMDALERWSSAQPDWLHLSPASGTSPSHIEVSFSLSGLAPDRHAATILVHCLTCAQDRFQFVDVLVFLVEEASRVYLPAAWRMP